jgi:DNA-binding CsgD family transcriptional regulator
MPVLTALLNLVPVGVVVVRARRQIVLSNPAADQILASEDLLVVRDGRLAALPSAYDRALTDAIDLAARDTFSRPTAFCMVRSQHAPVSVAVAPVDRGAAASSTLALRKVLVLISDPLHNIPVDPETLATMFEFTPGEALIAQHLVEGKDIIDVAQHLHLSVHTVRNHVKRLFSKTNTNKHCELLHLLLRSPAALRLRSADRDPETSNSSELGC